MHACIHFRFAVLPAESCKKLKDAGNADSGIYTISPDGENEFKVYCDMNIVNGEGWAIIQRRMDGSVDFDQPWVAYKSGFGDLYGNFWLGLEKLYTITSSGNYELYVAMKFHTNEGGSVIWSRYDSFSLSSSSSSYKLSISGYDSSSTAGDSLVSKHDKQKFSTKDADNDEHPYTHCAKDQKSGWWFEKCYDSNLNGVWSSTGPYQNPPGITWESALYDYSFHSTVMAIKEA